MDINIASAIEEMLDRRETVSIEGIGSLLLENLSAKFTADGKGMSPPSAYLTFFDTQTKNKPLRKYLSKKYDISKEEAQKAISKFSKEVLKALNKHKEVNIEGILKFEKSGKKVKMSALKGFQDKYYKGLPVVPATKLKKVTAKNKGEEKKSNSKKTSAAPAKFKVKVPAPKPSFTTPKIHKDKKSVVSKLVINEDVQRANKIKVEKPKSNIADPVKAPKSSIADHVKVSKPSITDPVKVTKDQVTKDQITKDKVAKAKSELPKKPKLELPTKSVAAASAAIGSLGTKIKDTGSSVKSKVIVDEKAAKDMNLNDKLKQGQAPASTTVKASSSTGKTEVKTNIKTEGNKSQPFVPVTKSSYTSVPPAKEGLGCRGPLLGFLGLLLLCFLLWKGCNYIMGSDTKTGKKSATEMLTSEHGTEGENTTEESISNNNGTDGTTEIIADVDECIIITGVFSDFRNVKVMEKKLAQLGFNVYSEEYGPYTRVGFRFDCSDEDKPEYLHKIRARYAKKAWYLVPELYVEYR